MLMTRLEPRRATGLLPPLYGTGDEPADLSLTATSIERPRVMMYSHDGIGLGHMRRNANIASRFVESVQDASVLMVGSAPTGLFFPVPAGVDSLKLPSIIKVGTNHWEPRSLRVESSELRNLRAHLIRSVAERFEPHLFIADHLPAGVWGELLPTLRMFRRRSNPPRVILGLRDILDSPDVVREAWSREGVYNLIGAYYDCVLIYGSRTVYDSAECYQLTFPGKLHYCGYVCAENACLGREQVRAALGMKARQLVVVSAGGGADGYPMLEACARALRTLDAGSDLEAVLVTGPIMADGHKERLEDLARGHPIRVLDTVVDSPSLMNAADLVITMGGYNTVVEALRLGKKILVIPREGPSAEQRTRANLLAEIGLVRALALGDATPSRLAQMIRTALEERSVVRAALQFDGARRVVTHMKRELATWSAANRKPAQARAMRRAAK
jgi:predicted glycosyltransferase